MKTAQTTHSGASALRRDIRRAERELQQRRQRITQTLVGIRQAARRSIVSPEALLTAGVVGVMLQRGQRRTDLLLMSVLQTATAGSRIWKLFATRAHAPDRAAASPG
jgi:hypothetical protein